MKKIFFLLLSPAMAMLMFASCSQSRKQDEQIMTSDFTADTIKVHQLLTSFSHYMNRNEIDKLLPIAKETYALAKQINYEDGMAKALTNLRGYYSAIGDYPRAMDYSLSALELNEKNKNDTGIAQNYIDIGMVHFFQKNFDEALNYYQKAMNINQKRNNRGRVATVQFLFALVFVEQKKDSLAFQYLNEALKVQKELGEHRRMGECEQAIGDIFLQRKQYSDAVKSYISSARHFEEANETMGAAVINTSVAKLFLQTNQPDKAEPYALDAVNYFSNINYNFRLMTAYEVLHQIYAAQKKFDKAYALQTKLVLLRDSVFGSENASKISLLETSYETQKRQIELEQKSKEVRVQQTVRNFFIAGFTIVAILAFLTFRQYRVKKMTAQKLEVTLEDLKKTQEQLVYTEKMSSLGKLSAGIAHEIQNPLNFVNNFSELGISLLEEFKTASTEEERTEIIGDLLGNLQKISEHGKRADGIVKSMLDHTHIGSREKRPTDLNRLANEFFTLAYQSFRSKEPGFTCEIEKRFDKNLQMVNVNPQDISRVMINLFNNALYALNKKKIADSNFNPQLKISSQQVDGKVFFSVWDNGPGVSDEIRKKIFQPFFTTKSAGEGTGLGLSLSHDIITQGHDGTLEVKSIESEGSEFIISLPA